MRIKAGTVYKGKSKSWGSHTYRYVVENDGKHVTYVPLTGVNAHKVQPSPSFCLIKSFMLWASQEINGSWRNIVLENWHRQNKTSHRSGEEEDEHLVEHLETTSGKLSVVVKNTCPIFVFGKDLKPGDIVRNNSGNYLVVSVGTQNCGLLGMINLETFCQEQPSEPFIRLTGSLKVGV